MSADFYVMQAEVLEAQSPKPNPTTIYLVVAWHARDKDVARDLALNGKQEYSNAP